MPKDDEVFAADVESAFEALWEAFRDESSTADVLFAKPLLTELQAGSPLFTGFGRITGGTSPVLSSMSLSVRPVLSDLNPEHGRGPIDTIESKLEWWDGPSGSPQYEFKNGYLPDLYSALGATHGVLQAAEAAMALVEAIIDQARQKYLDLLESTLARMGQVARARKRASNPASMVTAVFSALATVFSGGVASVILGGVAAVGAVIDHATTDPGEGEYVAILRGALDRAAGIRSAVEEEAGNVATILDGALNYVVGPQQDRFLAPEVGPVR
ncbi:hypothetical protein [Glycomyces salinus]|uniref:hypothetical protein n=1 Tax=Glycomyces salinus TaxID=980294 RepID=UPI0018ED3B17|nr:hypothetical protein [Glycomyces salinus]